MTLAYLPQDNHWLEDVALMRVRIKVRSLEDGPGSNDLEVVSTEMGRVKVRDGMRTRKSEGRNANTNCQFGLFGASTTH
jgi:hypothetical protein